MKKILLVIITIFLCFISSSFSLVLLSPQSETIAVNTLPDESAQKVYAVMDAVSNYAVVVDDSQNQVINKLASEFASNMVVNYNDVLTALNTNAQTPTITVLLLNTDKAKLNNKIDFDFTAYNEYSDRLSENAVDEIYKLIKNNSFYTKEYEISVTFEDTGDYLLQSAILNQDDLQTIKEDCVKSAEQIYEEYISTSEISTAYFCKSIKEMPTDNILEIYNKNNENNPMEEEWRKKLFISYSQHYLDSLKIQSIINSNVSSVSSTGTITYKIEDGSDTINAVFNQLLNSYYINKQTPVEKEQIIEDFNKQLNLYKYTETTQLIAKTFEFTYSQNLNEFDINDDFYTKIVDDIYEEFTKFDTILEEYYPIIEDQYFFVERPFEKTTVITDYTNSSRYRQLDINVTVDTDCYVKLYCYDTVTDTINDLMLVAYIKAGESLQVFIPEGDYIFKYATGSTWYGELHMFSDTGQYFAGTDVLSVHEYMMTTTIELGKYDDGGIATYPQTPDIF